VSKTRINLGKEGEKIAAGFLRENQYRILKMNYKNRFGEIDVIAKDKDTICFIEVKARTSDEFGLPEEALTPAKQKKISQVAVSFLKEKKLLDQKARFDVVSVMDAEGIPKINLIKNAFELAPSFTI